MGTSQLGLLLWKNYLVRKRQPGILGLVFLWPIAIFLLLYTVRDNVEPVYNPTCQFPGRMLPQNGLLSFLQSFVCSVDNPCEPLSAYKTMPSYRNAKLGPLFEELEPLLANDTLVTVIKNLPKGTKLLESMAQIFTQPHVKSLFEKGIHVGDLFVDHEFIKSYVKSLGLKMKSGLMDAILQNASINLAPLIGSFGSTDIDDILCSSKTLSEYLVVPDDLSLEDVTQILCNLDSMRMVALVNQLTHHLDIKKFLEMLDRAISTFRQYDFFNDLSHAVEKLLHLKTIERFAPSYLKLERWLPFVIPLFRNVTFREMDLTFINKSLALLEPVFQDDRDWSVARHAFISLNEFLTVFEKILRESNPIPNQHPSDSSSRTGTQYSARERKELRYDIGKAFDLAYVVLTDGVTLTNRLIDRHQNEIGKESELLDALRNIFPKNVINVATYCVSLTEKFVRTVEHVAMLYSEMPRKFYEVSLKHKDVVKHILRNLQPSSFEALVQSFSHAIVAQHFIEEVNQLKNVSEAICQDGIFREIFNINTDKHENDSAVLLKDLLCNNQTKKFISELYHSFELTNFQDIIANTLSTFVTIAFQQPVALEKSNVTSLLSSMRKLFGYLDRDSEISIGSNEIDWQRTFDIPQEWMEVFRKNVATGRLDVLAIHLAMAQFMGSRSLAYMSIVSDLKRMDTLAAAILNDVRSEPNSWIVDVRKYQSQLLETFYLTLANRKKVLKILEFKNFTEAYCNASISTELLEYPESSNAVILKKTVCRLSSLVEINLDRGVIELDNSVSTFNKKMFDFNWTAFNDKTIEIYKYIDSLLHGEDVENFDPEVIERSRRKFKNAWTVDLSIQDAWEISVGLICKLFAVMESPLFNIQSKETWKNLYGLAWATDVIQEHLGALFRHLQEKNYSLELSEVLREMPQTEILAKLLLENLAPLTLDILDTITLTRPLHLFTGIAEYKKREPDWPCIHTESIGAILDLRSGSRQVVREIERISCNPGLFLREWTDQPAFAKLRKIWGSNDTEDIENFDWTFGYVKFRRLVANITTLIEKSDVLSLPDMSQSFSIYANQFLPEVIKIFKERSTHLVEDVGKQHLLEFVEFLDLQIDKSVKAFRSNASASDILTKRPYTNNGEDQEQPLTMQDRILILTKFLSQALNEIPRVVLQVLQTYKDTPQQNGSIDFLSLLGFAGESPVSIVYQRFPELLATIINGLNDPKFLSRIGSISEVSCSDVFSWFGESRVPGISEREYRILKNFTCDEDPENFNLFTDLYLRETFFWKKPVSEYRCRFARAAFNFYELGKTLQNVTLNSIIIEPPYSSRYFYRSLNSLKEILKDSQYEFSNQYQELPVDKWPRFYQLVLPAFSQLLSHATDALHSWNRNNEKKSGHSTTHVLYSWNFVKDGDVRQLVKLLEAHPIEAISLLPEFKKFDIFLESNTTESLPLRTLRGTVCDLRYKKDGFWTQPNHLHFLKELCSFDPYQLLRSTTGEQFFDAALGRTNDLRGIQPLCTAITNFLDIFLNLTAVHPELSFRSNLINATTWKNLPTDTNLQLIKFEASWVRSLIRKDRITFSLLEGSGNNTKNGTGNQIWDDAFDLVRMSRFLKIVSGLIDWISGGDIWQKVRDSYKESKIEPLLDVIEELPNLFVAGIDTFLYSNQLNDYILGLLAERNDLCDFEHYLLVPSFIQDKSLRSRLQHFCKKLLKNEENLTGKDFIPFNKDQETAISRIQISTTESMNETYFFENLKRFQLILIQSLSDGFEPLKFPKWWISFENKSLEDFHKLFGNKNSKELSQLVVQKSMLLLRGLLESSSLSINRNCSWCSAAENAIDILNSQLSHHALYGEYFCKAVKWNSVQLKEAFLGPLGWNKTITMLHEYEIQTQKRTRTLEEFVRNLEVSLNYVLEIIVDYSDAAWREKTINCFYEFVGGPNYSRAGLWITLGIGGIDILRHNLPLLNSTAIEMAVLENLSRTIEKSVPIWKPLSEVIKSSEMKNLERLLPNTSINVNLFYEDNGQNASSIQKILTSKKSRKLIRYSYPRQQLRESCLSCLLEISEFLARSVDPDILKRELPKWRKQKTWTLTWLDEALEHLSLAMTEVATLLDLARKIDFDDISKILQTPDIVDGILKLLQDKTVDKLFEGLYEILDDMEPFFTDPIIKEDLHRVIQIFESLEIFKNLGLLNVKYPIEEMFINWDELRSFLANEIRISDDVVGRFAKAKLDTVSILRKQQKNINFKETICSPEFDNVVRFDPGPFTAEDVSSMLCHLDEQQTQNLTIALLGKLNFPYILHNLMSVSVKNILSKANLSKDEGKELMGNFTVVGQLVRNFAKILPAESFTLPESSASTSSLDFVEDAGQMMCGRAVFGKTNGVYKVLSRIEEQNKEFDKEELASLPTDFCRETYKNVVRMNGGKIIWSYVKPLLRGHILYSPKTKVVDEVMSLANETFVELEKLHQVITGFGKSLVSLEELSSKDRLLENLQEVLSSETMKLAIQSFFPGNADDNDGPLGLDLPKLTRWIRTNGKLLQNVNSLEKLMECVLVNRIRGFDTEEDLEREADVLTHTNEFLAGVIFVPRSRRSRRTASFEDSLPDNVTYKIRMDVDYVPITSRLKNQFWSPGPESNFIEDLRYLRGFIQLQDSVDRAIIRSKIRRQTDIDRSGQDWTTLIRQMPYPCWKYAPFQSTLYESQGIQTCFFFALMICVGAAIRHIVWEKESQNAMVMSVMGLKPSQNTLAWYLTSFLELAIIMISICIILTFGKILPRSDPSLLLFLFFTYIFSIVSFCYMISRMFNSASLAAVSGVVSFLLMYMPYVVVIAMEANLHLGYKMLMCLSMSTSFSYGCLYAVRREVQGTGLTWGTVWEESSPEDPMSLGLVLLMLVFDGCLYTLIGYLISRSTNSGYIITEFLNLESRCKRDMHIHSNYTELIDEYYLTNEVTHPSSTHQESESNTGSLTISEKQVGVSFERVRKVYRVEGGQELVAVEDLNLKLHENEVTALLGRNGAGKTTIIKMLTGMLAPSSGNIRLSSNSGTKPEIGVCPQENVLIDCLTAREHMIFYAKLKKPDAKNKELLAHVNTMLESLELSGQEDEVVSRLSGGTRRRLCVALAFLASPKLVILDEPGAGVDPAARRRIWRLIDKHRQGRTVLLSTHHLDEADMLSDTAVLMHKAKILWVGSPLSLKTSHGKGYKLHISFAHSHDTESSLRSTTSSALFKLPGATTASLTTTSIDEKLLETLISLLASVVPNVTLDEISASHLSITLPFNGPYGTTNDIAAAARVLEENQHSLNFSHFSLECDNLESVFLELCGDTENQYSAWQERGGRDRVGSLTSISNEPSIRKDSATGSLSASRTSISLGMSATTECLDLIGTEEQSNLSGCAGFSQAKALLQKRLWHFARDWRAPLAALLLPTLFVAVAMGFSLIRPPSVDEPPLHLTPNLYETNLHAPTHFYSTDNNVMNYNFLKSVSQELRDRFAIPGGVATWQMSLNDTGSCQCVDGEQQCHSTSRSREGLVETPPGRPTLDWIISTHQQYIEKRYGGWSLGDTKNGSPLFTVWYNNKGHHSLPAYLSALNEAILRASGIPGHITTINHPLKLSRDQLNRTSLVQHVADVGVALVLLIAFSMVGAQGARELVRERLSEEKRIIYLAGVHPFTYWSTAFLWDFFVFGCSICLAVVVFQIFGLSTYVARDNLPAICLVLILFAWAVIPLMHLVEKIFNDASVANMVLFCVNTFIGVAALATILVIDILGKSKTAEDVREILHKIFLVLPQYALGDSLVRMAKNDITAELLERFHMDTYVSPLGWELLGLHYVVLLVVGAIFYLLNLAIECHLIPGFPGYFYCKGNSNENSDQDNVDKVKEDEDVIAERKRVEWSREDHDLLRIINLRKEYQSVDSGKKVAVQDLSFGVQAGECFGLLGVNGAGKSTTFKMLTGEVELTDGRIIVAGKEVSRRPDSSGKIGYCPQNDALDGFLTPREILSIHARICGLRNVSMVVDSTLERFDLTKYARQRVDSLSGGNKRKLCVARSVMSPGVSIVLMDEPSSGMDPASKELVARAVRRVVYNRGSVLMTSHSVAECENICTRVGILGKGQLRCIGSPKYLKHKYGKGYVAFLRVAAEHGGLVELKRAIAKHLPDAIISSRQTRAARLVIPHGDEQNGVMERDLKISEIFEKVKRIAEELGASDYTLNHTSLDQVLVNFSEPLPDDEDSKESYGTSSNSKNISPRKGSSSVENEIHNREDVIAMETF